jgi:hypothetical protein
MIKNIYLNIRSRLYYILYNNSFSSYIYTSISNIYLRLYMKNSIMKDPLDLLLFLIFIYLSTIIFIQLIIIVFIPKNSEDTSPIIIGGF